MGIFGALAAIQGRLTVGQLSSFLSYANQYTKPFNEISGVVTELQNALACASRIFDLIEEEPQVPEKRERNSDFRGEKAVYAEMWEAVPCVFFLYGGTEAD